MGDPTHIPRSRFSALARDLKLDIFDFVNSKSDQGNACLVNQVVLVSSSSGLWLTLLQEWNQLMRPRMWRDFTTSLLGTFVKQGNALTEAQKACFHDIRMLTVSSRKIEPDYYARFSNFLSMVRDDQLFEFSNATDSPLQMMHIFSLLHRQSNLKCFRARLDVSSAPIEDLAAWSTELDLILAQRSLETLSMYIGNASTDIDDVREARNKSEMAYSDSLMKAASRLHRLELRGWRQYRAYGKYSMPREHKTQLNGLFQHTNNAHQISRTLRHLVVADLDLLGVEDSLMGLVNLDTLAVLRLEYCERSAKFIRALAAALRRQTTTTLRSLTFRSSRSTAGGLDADREAIEDLLRSFTGLDELECSMLWSAGFDWKSSLARHPGLRTMLVSSRMVFAMLGEFDREAGLKTITEILASCPSVQQFAYPPPTPLNGNIEGSLLPSTMDKYLYKSLDVIVTAPALHTLRLLWAPGIGEDKQNRENTAWIEMAARMAHRLATLILTHLHHKGSSIKHLAFSPESRWKQARADGNGHLYPHYFYKLKVRGVDGQEVVDAAPYVAEYPIAVDAPDHLEYDDDW
jgi:hypothetical protein